MARPTGWDILGLDGDPTPGVVESVQALAKEFGDFAHDVESAYRSLNSFGSDTAAMQWIGQTAEAFKSNYGPLPGRLQKLYTSYGEAADALNAYAPKLQAAQTKADTALRQAQDAHADLQRATTNATTAATDLKTAQQNQAANPNQQAVTDAQTAHDTAQTNLNNAKARMADLTKQAQDAYNDRIDAAKACASAIGKAQHDGIHNKPWWEHVGAVLSEWGGEIGKIAGELAPVLDIVALATSWIPGVDVVTAALAEADNIIALAGTAMATIGDAMQGHWGDALLGAGMLALTFVGGRVLGSGAEDLEGEEGALVRTADGDGPACVADDPVDVVSGWMLTDATDVELPGVLPVVLRRAYASGYQTGRLFGPGWSSTLDQRLSVNASGIHMVGDDAQRLDYPHPGADEETLPVLGSRWPLVWDRETDEIRVLDPWSGHTRHFAVVHFQNETGQIRDLTAITDRTGNRISILRDEQGTPTAVEHPGYRVAVETIPTAAGPRVSALRLLAHDGTETVLRRFSYDERGRLTGVINASGLPFRYEWDDADRITAWHDRAGYRFGYVYDERGRVIRGEGAFLGGSFEYDPANRTTVHTDSLGHATTFVYDRYGHITAETDPLGRTTYTDMDAYGRIASQTDALGNVTSYERDEDGDIRRIIEADGSVLELEYNEFHRAVAVTYPGGALWTRDYDDHGNLLRVTNPAGAVTAFDYDASGALTAVTDPLGAVTRYATDAAGLLVEIVDPVGGRTHAIRDAAGRIAQLTDPVGATTTMEWNADGQPMSRTGPDGAVTRWEHDAGGQLVKTVNPLGATTVVEPGPMGTVLARTGPDGVRLAFAYDSELNLLSVTNPGGGSWDYRYDAAGQLVGETDFNGRRLGYEYDAAGRLIARTTGTGDRLAMERDPAGRVVGRRTPEGDYAYAYDAAGRLASAAGPASRVEFERDILGRVLAESVDGHTTRYGYDLMGRPVSRTTASGARSAWSFDAAGRPVGLDAGSGHLALSLDAAGRETQRLLGPDAMLSFQYDAEGRPVSQVLTAGDSPAATLSRSWTWRADGVPETIDDNLRGPRRIVSDRAGRPTALSARDWSESYAYDTFGNLVAGTVGDSAEHEHTATRTLIRQAGRTHYEYDEAGRVVRTVRRTLDGRRKTWAYSWDSQDRLVQADTPDNGSWRYSYDPLGRRIGKQRVTADGGGGADGRDGADSGDGTDAEQVRFTWDGPRLAEQTSPGPHGTVTVLTWDYDPSSFRPAAQRRRVWVDGADQPAVDEAFHAIVTDLAGAPSELVAADGHIVWHTTTDVWGRTVGTSAENGVDCPLRFPGQYHDTETGLHYNLYRYYNPATAAYLTPDPLGIGPSPNDHAYVPNPVTGSDPLGLYEVTDGGGCGDPTHSSKCTCDNGDPVKLKRGPKPSGTGPHNLKIEEVAGQVDDGEVIAGGGALPERAFDTPGGFKSSRRPDILVQRPDGSVYGINVGKQAASGAPIKREAEALQDLEGIGIPMHFVPYN